MFMGLGNLQRLWLYSNQLTTLPADTFVGLGNLQSLPLYDNQLDSLSAGTFVGLGSLDVLYLDSNQLTSLPADIFVGLGNLRFLYLHTNQLTSLSAGIFVGLGSLRHLFLYTNQLTSLSADIFVGLSNLQYLHLHSNQLTSLPAGIFVGLGSLRYLYLYNNQLTSLTAGIFVGLGNLERLRLEKNNIHSIEAGTFNDTTTLRHLDLGYNNISTITAKTFGNLLQLKILRLSSNNINTFPVEALSNLQISPLSELTLDNNQLETLPPMAYDILASISDVNIDNNPWQCDCRMVPFKQRMSGSYTFEDQIRCAGPANLTGQLLRDVNPEDLICEKTTPVYSTSSTKYMVDSTDPPFASTVTLTLSLTESNTGPGGGGIVLSVPLLATLGVILGLLLICTIAFAVWCMYKRRQRDPTPQQGFRNTNPTSSGHDQIGLNTVETNINADMNGQSRTPHLGREDSLHIYNLPTDEDPDTAEYNTIDDTDQLESDSQQQDAGNRLSLDSFGYLNLTPSLPPKNQTGPQAAAQIESADAAAHTIGGLDTRTDEEEYDDVLSPSQTSQPGSGQNQHLGSFNDGYEVPSPSLYPGEGPQSPVNSHMAAAAKDAAAGPQDVVYSYENEDEIESAKEGSQSHKYVNSHVTAADKNAAAGPQDVVYDNENAGPQDVVYGYDND
ncbi:uncharacterized protein LOC144902965 [Branchiostoma floridae x Branchiostoma belcheri]